MSLILNNDSTSVWNFYDDGPGEDGRDALLLDRYLAIMETNRKSSRFVPDDALLALDMAGFVRGQIGQMPHCRPQVSIARLSLALVQSRQQEAPIQ